MRPLKVRGGVDLDIPNKILTVAVIRVVVSTAFTILSDPQKRAAYDANPNVDPSMRGGGGGGFDPSMFAGRGGGFGNGGFQAEMSPEDLFNFIFGGGGGGFGGPAMGGPGCECDPEVVLLTLSPDPVFFSVGHSQLCLWTRRIPDRQPWRTWSSDPATSTTGSTAGSGECRTPHARPKACQNSHPTRSATFLPVVQPSLLLPRYVQLVKPTAPILFPTLNAVLPRKTHRKPQRTLLRPARCLPFSPDMGRDPIRATACHGCNDKESQIVRTRRRTRLR